MLVAPAHLRTQLPHARPAALYGVGRSTATEAIGEMRPPLADCGFAAPDKPGLRLRTLADVFAYDDTEGVTFRIDGTQTQIRRPKTHRPSRCTLVSGEKKQNTMKTTTISEGAQMNHASPARAKALRRGRGSSCGARCPLRASGGLPSSKIRTIPGPS
ncbi:hypothetical protein OG410_06285 [Streptomyces sp. NBC_00659]|uniref:hypothetical protein n=1 Tax=Streptomyces sp. NBC_00659 TaxID=2903669 RepID=UPI002E30D0E4|nr:hypothetical protein [Streptomyces sp. NBC_00659]